MKKILSITMILIWAGSSMFGCTSVEQENEKMNSEVENSVVQLPDAAKTLVLNNGEKWKADSITNVNVAAIEGIIAKGKPVTLEDHLKTAGEMQEALNKLIKDCRMKGPEHDALHHWLEPFLATHKQLLEVKTLEAAQTIYMDLSAQIKVYPEFFE